MTTTFVDADSIAYSGGYNEYHAEMEMTIDHYINDIRTATQCEKLVGYVERTIGKANFRKAVAMTKPYKGNRRSAKPPLLDEAKLYLVQKYGFQWVTYVESEDACSISAHANGLENSVIAYIDKDLEMIPMRFYNYQKKTWKVVDEEQGEYTLWKQVLTGDGVDNITGIPGCGPKKAEKILADGGMNEWKMLTATAYKKHGFNYQYLVEQARLIYILRYLGEVFTPCTFKEWESIDNEV